MTTGLENLEWCTRSENMKHAFNSGLRVNHKGREHYRAKLTEEQVREIRDGHRGLLQREIAEIYGVGQSIISAIRLGKSWSHL